MDHLTLAQLEAYRKRTLPPDGLLAADRHLKTCVDCRCHLTAGAGLQMSALAAATGSGHLTYEELEAYVDESLSPAGKSRVDLHLNLCSACRLETADLAAYRLSLAPPAAIRPRWIRLVAVIAAVLVVALGIRFIVARQEARNPLVEQAIASGQVSVPAAVLALRGTRSSLRGEASEILRLDSPVATAVLTPHPEFKWAAAAAGARYTVTVFDEQQHRVTRSPLLSDSRWTPPQALTPGFIYEWQLRVETTSATFVAPAADQPPARFLVVNSAIADQLQSAAANAPADHLLLGVLYARAGLLDLAESELTAAGPSGSKLLAFVQSVRQ